MITYLASPYSPTSEGDSIEERVTLACRAAATLMRAGHNVFAPIPHSHAVAEHLSEEHRFDHEFWMKQDLAVLRHCGLLVVLKLAGWDRSRGVARELELAETLGIPIVYMEECDVTE